MIVYFWEKAVRQGDILLVPVSEIPQGLKEYPRENGRLVLARGETTGHAHAVIEPQVKAYGDVAITWIASPVPFEVKHEEHTFAPLTETAYRVVRQSEYRRKEIQRIAD